jgi:hypothetical protein
MPERYLKCNLTALCMCFMTLMMPMVNIRRQVLRHIQASRFTAPLAEVALRDWVLFS